MKSFRISITIVFLSSASLFSNSAGFENDVSDAAALAQSSAVTARAENPSTLWTNPAGMGRLKSKELQFTMMHEHLQYEFDPIASNQTENTDQNFIVPSFYYVHPFSKWRIGLGVHSPFGLSLKWDDLSTKYLSTKSEIKTIYYSPTAAYQFNKKVSLGVGINIVDSEGELNKNINASGLNTLLTSIPTSSPDANSSLKGDDTALSFNIGYYYQINRNSQLGITYRTETKLDLGGSLRLSNLTGAAAAVFGASSYELPASMVVKIPAQLSLGYRKQMNRLTLEADLDYTFWSSIDQFKVDFQEPNSVIASILNSDNPTLKKWDDTFNIALGGEYKVKTNQTFMFGTRYRPSPAPGDSADPSTPINDLWNLDIGYSFEFKRSKLDFALGHAFGKKRDIDNSVGKSVGASADGSYTFLARVIGMSYSYKL